MDQLLFQAEILWPAMVAGLLILATHIPLGREVLQRGIIFLDLAVAQIAAFGVVAANMIGLYGHGEASYIQPSLIAMLAAIIGALGLYKLRKSEVRIQESIIGILFILAATGSLLLLSADPHGGERLKETLVGQILWLQPKELLSLFLAYAAILCAWYIARKKLGDWVFYPLFAITITLSTQIVGVYLVFASLIIPALATFNQHNPTIKAFALGTTGYGAGLISAAIFDLPAGAAITWCIALIALLYYCLSTLLIKINAVQTTKSGGEQIY